MNKSESVMNKIIDYLINNDYLSYILIGLFIFCLMFMFTIIAIISEYMGNSHEKIMAELGYKKVGAYVYFNPNIKNNKIEE